MGTNSQVERDWSDAICFQAGRARGKKFGRFDHSWSGASCSGGVAYVILLGAIPLEYLSKKLNHGGKWKVIRSIWETTGKWGDKSGRDSRANREIYTIVHIHRPAVNTPARRIFWRCGIARSFQKQERESAKMRKIERGRFEAPGFCALRRGVTELLRVV
jgi:hypothetical protein